MYANLPCVVFTPLCEERESVMSSCPPTPTSLDTLTNLGVLELGHGVRVQVKHTASSRDDAERDAFFVWQQIITTV
jgi:hypothetical protein